MGAAVIAPEPQLGHPHIASQHEDIRIEPVHCVSRCERNLIDLNANFVLDIQTKACLYQRKHGALGDIESYGNLMPCFARSWTDTLRHNVSNSVPECKRDGAAAAERTHIG